MLQQTEAPSRAQDARAVRRLEYFTLAWNLTEPAVAVGAGIVSGSIALIGLAWIPSLRAFPAPFYFGGYSPTSPMSIASG